jgi:hypothetical protein
VFWPMDSWTRLRLALDAVGDGGAPVRYDLDDLLRYQLLVLGNPITDQAREERRETLARAALAEAGALDDWQRAQRRQAAEQRLARVLHEEQAARIRLGQVQQELAGLQSQVIETRADALLQAAGVYEYVHPLDSAVAYKQHLSRLKADIKTGLPVVGPRPVRPAGPSEGLGPVVASRSLSSIHPVARRGAVQLGSAHRGVPAAVRRRRRRAPALGVMQRDPALGGDVLPGPYRVTDPAPHDGVRAASGRIYAAGAPPSHSPDRREWGRSR